MGEGKGKAMNWDKITKATIASYRAGVLFGIATLIWLGSNFLTQKEFNQYKEIQRDKFNTLEAQRVETLNRLLVDIDAVRRGVGRIEEHLLRRADVGNAVGKRQ